MKVLFDYQAFQMQRVGGVSNCFAELIAHLPQSIDWKIGLLESNNVHLREVGVMPNLERERLNGSNFLTKAHYYGKGTIYRFLNTHFECFPSSEHINKTYCKRLIKEQHYDLFHPTFFDTYFLDYIEEKPFVLTIHDFITDKFREPNHIQTKSRKLLASKASHLIAVSEKTKQDAMDFLHVSGDKISVIYHGVSVPEDVDYKNLIGGKYFLYVGRRTTYKNFIPMVKSMADFLLTHPDYKLVCTANDFTKEELSLFESLKIRGQIIHVFASYTELLSLYKYAQAFIYPSLYEGFGIPILEAYAMQCPVLLADESCFPEIAGDGAIYFKLNQQENTFKAMLYDFTNMSKKELYALIEKQNRRLERYSWEKSALQLSELYKDVVAQHKH